MKDAIEIINKTNSFKNINELILLEYIICAEYHSYKPELTKSRLLKFVADYIVNNINKLSVEDIERIKYIFSEYHITSNRLYNLQDYKYTNELTPEQLPVIKFIIALNVIEHSYFMDYEEYIVLKNECNDPIVNKVLSKISISRLYTNSMGRLFMNNNISLIPILKYYNIDYKGLLKNRPIKDTFKRFVMDRIFNREKYPVHEHSDELIEYYLKQIIEDKKTYTLSSLRKFFNDMVLDKSEYEKLKDIILSFNNIPEKELLRLTNLIDECIVNYYI